jgi:uncharacterized protein YggL (DUF469 family)
MFFLGLYWDNTHPGIQLDINSEQVEDLWSLGISLPDGFVFEILRYHGHIVPFCIKNNLINTDQERKQIYNWLMYYDNHVDPIVKSISECSDPIRYIDEYIAYDYNGISGSNGCLAWNIMVVLKAIVVYFPEQRERILNIMKGERKKKFEHFLNHSEN